VPRPWLGLIAGEGVPGPVVYASSEVEVVSDMVLDRERLRRCGA